MKLQTAVAEKTGDESGGAERLLPPENQVRSKDYNYDIRSPEASSGFISLWIYRHDENS